MAERIVHSLCCICVPQRSEGDRGERGPGEAAPGRGTAFAALQWVVTKPGGLAMNLNSTQVRKNILIAASIALLAFGAAGCKRSDSGSDSSASSSDSSASSGAMSAPSAGASSDTAAASAPSDSASADAGASAPAAASGASQ